MPDENLNKRLEDLHSRLADVTGRLDRMTNSVAEHDNRINKIEDGCKAMANAIRRLREHIGMPPPPKQPTST